MRGGVTALMALLPAVAFLLLLALGWQDYDRCLLQADPSLPATLAKAAGELFHPFGIIGLVPFLGLAALWHSRDNGRLTLTLWAGVFATGLWLMLPPSAQHHCDRKGVNGAMALIALVIPGLMACWIAAWNSRPRSTER